MAEAKSTFHLSDGVSRNWQPAKKNFFEVLLPSDFRLLKPGVSREEATEDDYFTNAQEAIRMSVSKFDPPHYELNDLSIEKGNSVVHYAGRAKFGDTNLVVRDYVGPYTKAILEAWQNLAYDVKSDKGGRAVNYKVPLIVYEYTSDYVLVRSWKLIGCWVQKIDEGSYDESDDDLQVVTATIIYDRAEPTIKNVDEEFPYSQIQ